MRLRHLALLGVLGMPGDHPLHTTLTEITQSGTELTITVRGFVDDLTLAAMPSPPFPLFQNGRGGQGERDSSIAGYLLRNLVLTGRTSRIQLAWRGVKHQADVAWFTYVAQVREGLRGVRVANSALCELYEDQVNIVQVTVGGSRRSLMFTPGDTPREIR